MTDYPIATELSYDVLQRQRRDPEVVGAPLHQSREHAEPIFVNKALRDLDAATPGNLFIDEVTPIPTWAWHGRGAR